MASPSDGDIADRFNTASLPPLPQELASAGPSGITGALPEQSGLPVEVESTGSGGPRHVARIRARKQEHSGEDSSLSEDSWSPRAITSTVQTPLIVAPLKLIRPTETSDPTHVATLVDKIRSDGALFKPIHVIERDGELLCLDGHHRRAAFEAQNLQYILAQLHKGRIEARTWVILSAAPPDTSELLEVAPAEYSVGLDSHGGLIDLQSGGHYLFPGNPMETLEAQRRQVEHLARSNGGKDLCRLEDWRRGYALAQWRDEAEREAPKTRSVLIYPTMTPERFVTMTLNNEAVPCGATRWLLFKIALRRGAPLELFDGTAMLDDIASATAQIIATSGFDVEEPIDATLQ